MSEVTAPATEPLSDEQTRSTLTAIGYQVQRSTTSAPQPWRRMRFTLPTNVGELSIVPSSVLSNVEYFTADQPAPRPTTTLVLHLAMTPVDQTVHTYCTELVAYVMVHLVHLQATAAVTAFTFVRTGDEITQAILCFASHEVELASRLAQNLAQVGLSVGFAQREDAIPDGCDEYTKQFVLRAQRTGMHRMQIASVKPVPPTATFLFWDTKRRLHNGRGMEKKDIHRMLFPDLVDTIENPHSLPAQVQQANNYLQQQCSIVEGFEEGLFYAAVRRSDLAYNWFMNTAGTFQRELFEKSGVFACAVVCDHAFAPPRNAMLLGGEGVDGLSGGGAVLSTGGVGMSAAGGATGMGFNGDRDGADASEYAAVDAQAIASGNGSVLLIGALDRALGQSLVHNGASTRRQQQTSVSGKMRMMSSPLGTTTATSSLFDDHDGTPSRAQPYGSEEFGDETTRSDDPASVLAAQAAEAELLETTDAAWKLHADLFESSKRIDIFGASLHNTIPANVRQRMNGTLPPYQACTDRDEATTAANATSSLSANNHRGAAAQNNNNGGTFDPSNRQTWAQAGNSSATAGGGEVPSYSWGVDQNGGGPFGSQGLRRGPDGAFGRTPALNMQAAVGGGSAGGTGGWPPQMSHAPMMMSGGSTGGGGDGGEAHHHGATGVIPLGIGVLDAFPSDSGDALFHTHPSAHGGAGGSSSYLSSFSEGSLLAELTPLQQLRALVVPPSVLQTVGKFFYDATPDKMRYYVHNLVSVLSVDPFHATRSAITRVPEETAQLFTEECQRRIRRETRSRQYQILQTLMASADLLFSFLAHPLVPPQLSSAIVSALEVGDEERLQDEVAASGGEALMDIAEGDHTDPFFVEVDVGALYEQHNRVVSQFMESTAVTMCDRLTDTRAGEVLPLLLQHNPMLVEKMTEKLVTDPIGWCADRCGLLQWHAQHMITIMSRKAAMAAPPTTGTATSSGGIAPPPPPPPPFGATSLPEQASATPESVATTNAAAATTATKAEESLLDLPPVTDGAHSLLTQPEGTAAGATIASSGGITTEGGVDAEDDAALLDDTHLLANYPNNGPGTSSSEDSSKKKNGSVHHTIAASSYPARAEISLPLVHDIDPLAISATTVILIGLEKILPFMSDEKKQSMAKQFLQDVLQNPMTEEEEEKNETAEGSATPEQKEWQKARFGGLALLFPHLSAVPPRRHPRAGPAGHPHLLRALCLGLLRWKLLSPEELFHALIPATGEWDALTTTDEKIRFLWRPNLVFYGLCEAATVMGRVASQVPLQKMLLADALPFLARYLAVVDSVVVVGGGGGHGGGGGRGGRGGGGRGGAGGAHHGAGLPRWESAKLSLWLLGLLRRMFAVRVVYEEIRKLFLEEYGKLTLTTSSAGQQQHGGRHRGSTHHNHQQAAKGSIADYMENHATWSSVSWPKSFMQLSQRDQETLFTYLQPTTAAPARTAVADVSSQVAPPPPPPPLVSELPPKPLAWNPEPLLSYPPVGYPFAVPIETLLMVNLESFKPPTVNDASSSSAAAADATESEKKTNTEKDEPTSHPSAENPTTTTAKAEQVEVEPDSAFAEPSPEEISATVVAAAASNSVHQQPLLPETLTVRITWEVRMSRSKGHYYYKAVQAVPQDTPNNTTDSSVNGAVKVVQPADLGLSEKAGDATVTVPRIIDAVLAHLKATYEHPVLGNFYMVSPQTFFRSDASSQDQEAFCKKFDLDWPLVVSAEGSALTSTTVAEQPADTTEPQQATSGDTNVAQADVSAPPSDGPSSSTTATDSENNNKRKLRTDEFRSWLSDQRVRNDMFDRWVIEHLEIIFKGSKQQQQQAGNGSEVPLLLRFMSSSEKSVQQYLGFAATYPPRGHPFPELPRSWNVDTRSKTGLYDFLPPNGNPTSRHPNNGAKFCPTPQAFAFVKEMNYIYLLDKLREKLEKLGKKCLESGGGADKLNPALFTPEAMVRDWLRDQTKRNPVIDSYVVDHLDIRYPKPSDAGAASGSKKRGRD